MKTEFYIIGSSSDDDSVLRRAGEIIKEGGLVAFPTETVYGLGANALAKDGAKKIYAAKGRPSDNPLIVHIASPEEAETIAYVPEIYYSLAEKYMPGPLTVIMPKKDIVPDEVTGGLDTVAVRCPENIIARKIISYAGVPIAAPSANVSGRPSPTSASHVKNDLDGKCDMIIDGGSCSIGVESTVISVSDGKIRILRPGAVTKEMLKSLCDDVSVDEAVINPSAAGEHPSSPGMKYKHYSPKADVILADCSDEMFFSEICSKEDSSVGVFVSDEEKDMVKCIPLSVGKTYSAENISRTLYSLLRECDKLNLRTVYIRKPDPSGRYLAAYNRLIRASGGKIIKL